MKCYRCDVCGVEVDDELKLWSLIKSIAKPGRTHVCAKCKKITGDTITAATAGCHEAIDAAVSDMLDKLKAEREANNEE